MNSQIIVPERFAKRVAKLQSSIERAYPNCEEGLIERTFMFAYDAHFGVFRADGLTPYIEHPLSVAEIVAHVEMDPATVQAALLHDTVEDCPQVDLAMVHELFGDEVAKIVDAVTKIPRDMVTQQDLNTEATDPGRVRELSDVHAKAQTLRKILVGVAVDIRVLAVKLADRLHNMRSLGALPDAAKRRRLAAETLQIYAPLAEKLGVWPIRTELEDIAFAELEPIIARTVHRQMDATFARQGEILSSSIKDLRHAFSLRGIQADVMVQKRHLYEVVMKSHRSELNADFIFDLFSIVVVVSSVGSCYETLGIVHGLWQPVPGKFEDFIARSRSNLYEALHTTVNGYDGMEIRVLIRSLEMHRSADLGLAAYWRDRESPVHKAKLDRRLALLQQQLLAWTQEKDVSPDEYLQLLREDLGGTLITVFTPNGDSIEMQAGSTPLDFAYRIHSELGTHYSGAIINRTPVPMNTVLNKGDVVEIIAKPEASPSVHWLSVAHTPLAQRAIKTSIRKQAVVDNIEKGRIKLAATAERYGVNPQEVLLSEVIQQMAKRLGLSSSDAFLSGLGDGQFSAERAILRLLHEHRDGPRLDVQQTLLRRAACCLPLPGDAVYGWHPHKSRGIVVHRADCLKFHELRISDSSGVRRMEWEEQPDVFYHTPVRITAAERTGLISSVSQALTDCSAGIYTLDAYLDDDSVANLKVTLNVRSIEHLRRVMDHLRKLSDVLEIHRVNPQEEKHERRRG